MTKIRQPIRKPSQAIRDPAGNLPVLNVVFPNYLAPIVRTATHGVRELAVVRWGMPSSEKTLFKLRRDTALYRVRAIF